MSYEIGTQYENDTPFKAEARLHQSAYRANVLAVDFHKYGNRMKDDDAEKLLNYYDMLGVREALRSRYPEYSERRDADMLRSEHIPYNLFAPLETNKVLAATILRKAFGIPCREVTAIKFEYAPAPILNYLNDKTAFDVFIQYLDGNSNLCGLGIEVKYTEKEYQLGPQEKRKVENLDSPYWKLTRSSKVFIDDASDLLASNNLRQVWRNHLLGLAMVRQKDIRRFTSITLFPEGNEHFQKALPAYQELLNDRNKKLVFGCTFEKFVEAIAGSEEFDAWREYLEQRYLVGFEG